LETPQIDSTRHNAASALTTSNRRKFGRTPSKSFVATRIRSGMLDASVERPPCTAPMKIVGPGMIEKQMANSRK
jgi:hypothetical protein